MTATCFSRSRFRVLVAVLSLLAPAAAGAPAVDAALVARVTAALQGKPLGGVAAAAAPRALQSAACSTASANASCVSCAGISTCAWCSNLVGSPATHCRDWSNTAPAPAGCGTRYSLPSQCPGGGGGGGGAAVAVSSAPTPASTALMGAALGVTLALAAAGAALSACLMARHARGVAPGLSKTLWAPAAALAAPLVSWGHFTLIAALALTVAAPIAPWAQYSSSDGFNTNTVIVSGLVAVVTTCAGSAACASVTIPNIFGQPGSYMIFTAAAILVASVAVTGVATARLRAIEAGGRPPASDCCGGLVAAEGTGWFALVWVVIGVIQISAITALFDALYRAGTGGVVQVVSGGGAIAATAIVLTVVGMSLVSTAACRVRGVPGVGRDPVRCCCTAPANGSGGAAYDAPPPGAVPGALTAGLAGGAPGAGAYAAYSVAGAAPGAYGGGGAYAGAYAGAGFVPAAAPQAHLQQPQARGAPPGSFAPAGGFAPTGGYAPAGGHAPQGYAPPPYGYGAPQQPQPGYSLTGGPPPAPPGAPALKELPPTWAPPPGAAVAVANPAFYPPAQGGAPSAPPS